MDQNVEEHLPAYKVRPRFQVATSFSLELLVEEIQTGLEKEGAPCKGWVHVSGYGKLLIHKEDQHYWSRCSIPCGSQHTKWRSDRGNHAGQTQDLGHIGRRSQVGTCPWDGQRPDSSRRLAARSARTTRINAYVSPTYPEGSR